uniref:Uncharacterized protein n=1 Tax=Arion vulgaris TaxID=1028688 RepID=A0A0B6Z506_9EUPU
MKVTAKKTLNSHTKQSQTKMLQIIQGIFFMFSGGAKQYRISPMDVNMFRKF